MASSVVADCALHNQGVAYNATSVNGTVAPGANDAVDGIAVQFRMPQRKIAVIHKGKTPERLHYLERWAELRGKKQSDFANEGLADKGTVSRWFSGQLPTEANLQKIAVFLDLEDANTIFRDPDDDWMRRLFDGRSAEERKRMLATLEAAFPPKKSVRS
jgi:transcriptional regulator with XRE-family HTH domain